jgi:hypothetical protein
MRVVGLPPLHIDPQSFAALVEAQSDLKAGWYRAYAVISDGEQDHDDSLSDQFPAGHIAEVFIDFSEPTDAPEGTKPSQLDEPPRKSEIDPEVRARALGIDTDG